MKKCEVYQNDDASDAPEEARQLHATKNEVIEASWSWTAITDGSLKSELIFFRDNDEVYYILRKTFELNNLAIAFTAAKMSTTSSSSSLGNAGRKTSAALGVKQSTRKLSARMNSEVADAFRLFDKVRIFSGYLLIRTLFANHWQTNIDFHKCKRNSGRFFISILLIHR